MILFLGESSNNLGLTRRSVVKVAFREFRCLLLSLMPYTVSFANSSYLDLTVS